MEEGKDEVFKCNEKQFKFEDSLMQLLLLKWEKFVQIKRGFLGMEFV